MVLIPAHNYLGRTAIIIGGVAGLLAIIAVALRLWARKIKGVRLDASDWTCISGLIVALALVGATVNTVVQGLGLPVEEVTYGQIQRFTKGMIVGIFLWTGSNTLVRISMILLYIRLFQNRKFVVFCWVFLVENATCAIATFMTACLICQPFAYNWDRVNIRGHCGNQKQFYLWNGILNLVHDVITIIMPMPFLWQLQLPWTKKISLFLIFGMGFGICVITLIRTVKVSIASEAKMTYDYASVGVLSILEPLLGIINCCLPLLRPILQNFMENVGGTVNTNTGSNSRPSLLHSIGTKRTRRKTNDPYPLDTFNTINGDFITEVGKSPSLEEGSESVKNLVKNDNLGSKISVKKDWNVKYNQLP